MGPKGVAVDKNGHIITVDNKACCVFIFQSNGKLVTKFGARGTSDRHFAGTVSSTSPDDHWMMSLPGRLETQWKMMSQGRRLGRIYGFHLCFVLYELGCTVMSWRALSPLSKRDPGSDPGLVWAVLLCGIYMFSPWQRGFPLGSPGSPAFTVQSHAAQVIGL